jgi:hypothetical protein
VGFLCLCMEPAARRARSQALALRGPDGIDVAVHNCLGRNVGLARIGASDLSLGLTTPIKFIKH